MIRFLYGVTGSGKSEYIYNNVCRDIKDGKKVLLLVPEQEVLKTELACARRLDGANSLGLEVVSFRRLCNRAFREYGGLCKNYVTKGGRAIIMWRALRALTGSLSYFSLSDNSDPALIDRLLSFITEMKAYKISADKFSEIAARLDPGVLADKTDDLAAIYLTFDRLLHESYDDASEDIFAAHQLFEENGFFPEYQVYIDSFYGYSPDECDIVSDIFRGAENVTVSLLWDDEKDAANFERTVMTRRALLRMARDAGEEPEITVLEDTPRFCDPVLSDLVRGFWTREEPSVQDLNGAVTVVSCGDAYNEAAWIAADIRKTVRTEGIRYRDVAVISRDPAKLIGVLDDALRAQEIPFHMSQREDITSYPLVRFVIFALLIAERGWKRADVVSYVKTGLPDISAEESDMLENYVELWDVNGRSRWCGTWNMNPRGFSTERTEADVSALDKLNDIRLRAVSPLERLIDLLTSCADASSCAEAVYDFLIACGVTKKLENENDVAVWNALCAALDDIAVCGGSERCDVPSLRKLLSCVFRHTDFGSIPSSADEVTVAGAANARVGSPVKVYLCGANEGEFPAYVKEDDLLDDADIRRLTEAGLDIEDNYTARAEDELLYFYRAAFSASRSIAVCYREVNEKGDKAVMSDGCRRFLELIPGKTEIAVKDLNPADMIESKADAKRKAFAYAGTRLGNALSEYFGEDPGFVRGGAVSHGGANFSPEITTALYGKKIMLTQTRIENYMDCPFAYGCSHILKLSEEGKKKYDPSDIGVYIHEILENYFRDASSKSPRLPDDTAAAVEILSDEYIECSIGGKDKLDARTSALFNRLKRTTVLLIDDIRRETAETDFSPRYFELPIGIGDDPKVKPLTVDLDDGRRAAVYGIIDRVDTFAADGDVYVRIVDYKTGKKALSVSDAEKGKNLQMLLYLFSICDENNEIIRKELDCEGRIIPAGVEYYLAKDPVVNVNNAEELIRFKDPERSGVIKRSGYAVDDERFLAAVDKDGEKRWLPVDEKGNSVLVDPAKFGELEETVRAQLADVANRMKSGDNSTYSGNENGPCRYCGYRSVCRREFN